MQKEPFEVGDIVDWHYPPKPQYCVGWAREYGAGPFEITRVDGGGVFIKPISGPPTPYLKGRDRSFNHEIFRTNQFLTAVHKAHAKTRVKVPSR